MATADDVRLTELLDWFADHLPEPKRLNRSRSKGHDRRATRGISWFRDSATKFISRMRELAGLLEAYGFRVAMIHEDRIGFIVYEDEFQVVAEPFSDTRTEGD